ncbi:MAG: prolipoprotein diacylglyceryl transferase [Clostridia bacterium]|nr:prolipoprotein diacylglyceryl transferase [Clostridia bacterium]
MYPYELFFGITLYEVLIVVGYLAAILCFRRYSEKIGMSAKLYNLALGSVTAAAIGGYLAGYLFQGIYDWLGGAPFRLSAATGSTFLGGLLGGLAILSLVYFVGGHFIFPDTREHVARFPDVMDGYAAGLALGHGFGRIGCLMAGCCHGLPSEHGIYFPELGYKAIPTQLYEAIFLFILAAVLWRLVTRTRGIGPAVYFIAYGVFRFTLEFWRGDDRGKTVIDFLTPSQLVSVLLVISGITLLLMHRRREGKRDKT